MPQPNNILLTLLERHVFQPQPYIDFACGHLQLITNKESFVIKVLATNKHGVNLIEAGAILAGDLLTIKARAVCPACLEAA